jgi:methionyl-tRNA synthetase
MERSGARDGGADVVAVVGAGVPTATIAAPMVRRPTGQIPRAIRTEPVARFYLTTAIDYANGEPHLGHAFEKIGADVIARYRRLCGDEVDFLIGLDEHGQKVAQAAASDGVCPQEFVDLMAAKFGDMWKRLNISNTVFMRTTGASHKVGVKALIERIHERRPDDFFEKTYEGWYCVGCELFKRENEIADGRCVIHPTRELQWSSERNWFFRLSAHAPFLRALIEDNAAFLRPESRRNEMLSLLDQGLEDISITRSRLSWAIPFPLPSSNGETQGTWVWFDALPNYLTATGFPEAGEHPAWPAQLHVVGKDINRLHSIVWPAMLHAAGLPMPGSVWVHGFVLLAGERFSKSAGVKLSLDEAIDRYGADAFRYYLMREVPFDADGSFSWERFEERYNSDLANAWGNLASRTLAMVEKYRGSIVPPSPPGELDAADESSISEYHAAMDGRDGYLLHVALRAVWASIGRGNEYVDRRAPWKQAKVAEESGALDETLASLIRLLARQCVLLSPFMPEKAAELWSRLGAAGQVSEQRFSDLARLDPTGWVVKKGPSLFPKEVPSQP